MKVAITGTTGFIGTNFASLFAEMNSINSNEGRLNEIVSISKFTQASNGARAINELAKNGAISHYWCDVTDYTRLSKILSKEKPDYIIHMAAEADVSRSFDYPYDFLKTNVGGTFTILEWLKENKETRMLAFSTDEVFSSKTDALHYSKEDDPQDPQNPYSASKAAMESYIHAYNAAYDTSIQIVRPTNQFGSYQGVNRLFAKTIVRCIENEPFNLFKETHNHIRWWCYVKDTFNAVNLIMEKGDPKGTYNIVSKNGLTVNDVVFKILDKFGKRDLFKGYTEIRQKDDENYALDGSKLRALGWDEKYQFDEALNETIKWYQDNISWFGKK